MADWDDERRAALELHLTPGIGPRLQSQLLAYFGSAARVLQARRSELRQVRGIGAELAQRIRDQHGSADRELQICQKHGVQIALNGDPNYSALLSHIPDPPAALFQRGEFLSQDELAVAIVGTRHPTRYGLAQAERLARGLATAGLTVISGLARGIDGAAHRGALAAGGRTIAVLASGVLNIYPPEHAELATEIASQGVVVSEAPPMRKPISGAFPQRNRIISGMSLGTIVVEAAERSGALITATHAGEQGREVLAVPGRVDSRMSRGCHQLLRDGAKLVEHVDDVLEELCPTVNAVASDQGDVRHPRELILDDRERQVLQEIGLDATHLDLVASRCGLPMHQVLATVSVLETRRLVQRISGATVARL